MSRFAAASLSIACLLASHVSSAPPASGKAAAPARPAPAFNHEASKLSPGFKGTDIPSFFKSLAVPSRGEFETTDAYEKRVAAFRSKGRPVVALVLAEEVVTGPHYDADAGEFTLLVRAEHPDVNGQSAPDTSIVRLPIASSKVVGQSYSASNAFGAKTVVKKVTETCYAAILPASDIAKPYTISIRVPADPAEAPRLKSRLRLMLACDPRPAPEAVVPRYERIDPTYQNPVEGSTSDVLIACDAAAFWAFDELTGRVLKKVPLAGEDAAAARKERP